MLFFFKVTISFKQLDMLGNRKNRWDYLPIQMNTKWSVFVSQFLESPLSHMLIMVNIQICTYSSTYTFETRVSNSSS